MLGCEGRTYTGGQDSVREHVRRASDIETYICTMNRVQEPFKVDRQDLTDLSLGNDVLYLAGETIPSGSISPRARRARDCQFETYLLMNGIESVILFERRMSETLHVHEKSRDTYERNSQVVVRLLDSSQDRLALFNVGRHGLLGQDLDTPFEGGDWKLDRSHGQSCGSKVGLVGLLMYRSCVASTVVTTSTSTCSSSSIFSKSLSLYSAAC